ncbi:hypothetical protein OIDMADRAFT_109463 [Oidiodendron maius Zn]|uniref:PCI domain-containing protein n=1 Tax=Oidiodendron maius (strain Zn) TaxID=913774 RepID=A0A0C3HJU0_OIDMZ|nr:hypothetical protein OIDMADRAFT_109463 [Oidiodendron maius Zn]
MSIVNEYLQSILELLRAKNSVELQFYLRVEPDPQLPDNFLRLSQELKTSYRDSNVLERHITKLLPENDDTRVDEGDVWPGFLAFIKEYLEYWRDVNFDDLLETHSQLSGLANACITALSHAQYGIIILPATIQLCFSLAKLAMTLDKRPDLTSRLRKVANVDQGESQKSLVEGTAESIQRAFTMCLTERSLNRNGIGKDGKPEGKKIGIYSFANLVLKLLFQVSLTCQTMKEFTSGVLEKFAPVTKAIRRGDLVAFKRALGPESGNEQWFFKKGILLPLLHRCEILVWRSLARRVFLLTYQFPTDPNTRKAPTLDLIDLTAAAEYCQKALEGWQKPVKSTQMQSGRMHMNAMFMKAPDLAPPPEGRKKLVAHQGVVFGNMMPDLVQVEAIVASLVQQGLLHGFISHGQGKFAILGSKQRGGPLNAGFPTVWEAIKDRAESEGRHSEVPGWVRGERKGGMGGVINLSGVARPVGSGG